MKGEGRGEWRGWKMRRHMIQFLILQRSKRFKCFDVFIFYFMTRGDMTFICGRISIIDHIHHSFPSSHTRIRPSCLQHPSFCFLVAAAKYFILMLFSFSFLFLGDSSEVLPTVTRTPADLFFELKNK